MTPMREKVGVVTLQERFDHYLWHECRTPSIAFAHHFEPASSSEIKRWLQGHASQKREVRDGA
jgi:hypothetical protein